ncbi:MAG: hypothetical protein KBA75_02175, partial [Alphaproteobacteria bacterium]|nr:hypothetical protein [Alphaproteobacteria bacterium]
MAGRQPRQMPGGETLDSGAPHSLLCRAGVRPCRAALLRQHDSESGFAIGAILFLLTMIGVGGAVLYSGYSQILRTNISITRENAARNDLIAASRTLSASAALINGGLNLQPPAVLPFASADTAKLPTNYANSGTTGSPTTVGVMQAGAGTTQLDPWGHYYVYCRWENATSPGTDPGILLITAGPDGVLDTKCGDLTAQNDDKIQILSVAQAIDRANVWQYQTTTGGSEVQFGITSNAVRVTNSGDISANSLTLAGALNAGSLALSAPLAVNQGGTGSSTAAGARSNLGSGAVGDALFTAATAGGGRGTLGSTTVGDALFTAATVTAARSTLGATAVGDSVFTAADAIAARAALGAQAVGDSLFQQDNADDALSVLGGTDVGKDIFTAVDAGAARTRLGATAVGSSVFTAASGAAARAAIGAGATGDAVFVAANQTQALTALGLLGGSLTLDVGITGTANTAVYLADGANILAGAVPIAHGGTGATTAATARSNLGMDNATNLTSGTLSWSRLPTSGVSAGSYNWGTVNSQGIVTAANNVNIIPNTVQGTAGGGSAGAVTVIGGSGFGYDNDGGDVNITGGEGGGGYVAGSVNITGGQDSMGTNGSINLTAYPAGAINLKGNTYVRPVTGTGSSSLNLWGNSDYDRFLNFTTTGTNRWALGADSTAESGGNAGSNFVIRNYDDAGALLGTPFSVDRATGNVTINGTVTATTFIGASGGAGAIALGTSATGTNPARSGELGTGLYSAASGLVDIASVGNEVARFSSSGIDARAGVFLQAGVQALKLSATGNPVVGNTTMSIASAPLSVAVGRNALASVTSEANSVAVGHRALASATSATGNTAVGYQVLAATTTGSWNTAMGYQALASSTTAVSNSAFGYQALVNTLTGTANTAVGMSAAFSNIGGGGNTGVGYQSLYTSSTNFYNTAVGYQALYFANGNFNSAFGASALLNTTTGTDNVAVGRLALTANTVGQYNIAVGNSALSSATTAAGQVAVGYQALTNATTATGNTAVGYLALANTTTGSGNTALGYAALQLNTTGQNNIAVGQFALRNIWSAAENTGNSNIAIGSYSLGGITNETNNIAIGHNAAVYSYGSNMTVVGVSALGDSSNHLVSDGSTVVGATSWSSGAYNAILGAGVGAYSGASGSANSAVGYHALYNSTTGINNVALGYSAGSIITTGSDNLILGYSVASTTLATGTNNILLGTSSAVDTPAAGTSNWLNIGNTIYGDLSNHRIAFGNAISATTTGVTFDLGNVTDSMRLPLGTTVQRPTGAQGMLRYNSTTGAGVVEYYDGATWQNVASGSSAGSIALGVSATANNPARSGELGTGLFSAATGQVSVASNGVE